MKTKLGIGILLLATLMACAQTNNLTSLLQQGLFEEQANRNLDAAIADYQSLATQFDQDRKIAATAIFRLGECYRAQGKTNEAATKYQRILQDFSDQTTLVALSRQNLAGMGIQAGPAVSAARQRQIELLENQIALAQTNLAEVQKRFQLGTATQSEVTAAEQQAVQLQITLAGLNATPATALNPASPAGSVEDLEIQRIQEMIQNSPDLINAPVNGSTPLVKAAYNGWLKVAAYLLAHGADVNTPCSQVPGVPSYLAKLFTPRISPLMAAVMAGNKAMSQFLIDHGADVHFQNQLGYTPLHLAAQKGFQAVTETLLVNHADVNMKDNSGATPLFSAVQNGQLKIVQMLLRAGAKVDFKDDQDRTIFNFAIGTSPEIVKALLEAGTNPNTEDKEGRTPLSYAVEKDSSEVVKALLDAKADPNLGEKNSPLLGAIAIQNLDAAELLLQAGAKPNAAGKGDFPEIKADADYLNHHDHMTPLWLAIYLHQPAMVRLLLKFKADPNDSQTDGRSLLFSALAETNILEALLDAGANVNTSDESGNFVKLQRNFNALVLKQTPIEMAAGRNNISAVEILLQHGANPNAADARGDTPLHWAALYLSDAELFRLLLDSQANPNVRNHDGETPLDIVKKALRDNYFSGRFSKPGPQGPSSEQRTLAGQLIDLLHQHGALDNLPDWDSIKISLPDANYTDIVFRKGTKNWNHFTLLELIYHESGNLSFANFGHIVIVRPNTNNLTAKRIKVDLLDATNGVDCAKDLPLEFGDVVEFPEREHTLAQPDRWTPEQIRKITAYLKDHAGSAKLIVAGGQTIELPLTHFEPETCDIRSVLNSSLAQNVLTSRSDLSHVKVVRQDSKTGKTSEWTLDCSTHQELPGQINISSPNTFANRLQMIINNASQPSPDLRDLRICGGDVIEVPEKP